MGSEKSATGTSAERDVQSEMDHLKELVISRLAAPTMDNPWSITQHAEKKWMIATVNGLHLEEDLPTLRLYSKLEAPITTFKYAEHAMASSRDGKVDTSRITTETMSSYANVVEARSEALDRQYIWGYGNEKILNLLIEHPNAEPFLLHLITELHVTDADEMITRSLELLDQGMPVPLVTGAL